MSQRPRVLGAAGGDELVRRGAVCPADLLRVLWRRVCGVCRERYDAVRYIGPIFCWVAVFTIATLALTIPSTTVICHRIGSQQFGDTVKSVTICKPLAWWDSVLAKTYQYERDRPKGLFTVPTANVLKVLSE